jgi:hypothetical protein
MSEPQQRSRTAPDTTKTTTTTTTTATASASVPPKDENIVIKTAHTIRDKVHEFTTDVKEKAHNLKHSDHPKK